MIIPVKEDGLDNIRVDGHWGPGFYLYVGDIRFGIGLYDPSYLFGEISKNRRWRTVLEYNLQRRTMSDTLPGDDVANSVVNVLNKGNNIAGMSILEYLTKMGFDVCGLGVLSKLKRWIRRLFKHV